MANPAENVVLTAMARCAGASEDQVVLEMFNTVTELCIEALRATPPDPSTRWTDPYTTWITTNTPGGTVPATVWSLYYSAISEGTLARLYAQQGKPFADKELAKFHQTQYLTLLGLARSNDTDAPSNSYRAVLYDLRRRIPLCRDADLEGAIFNAVNRIRQDALNLTPIPTAQSELYNWNLWLATDDSETSWTKCQQAIVKGALAELYSQANQPWASLELSQAMKVEFLSELDLIRSDIVGADTATPYARLVAAIRVQIPLVRESSVKLEAFHVADKIRREALLLTPLVGDVGASDTATWFPTTALWNASYQAMLHGVLARFYSQSNRPWANVQMAAVENQMYQQELDLVRGEQAADTGTGTMERLLDNLLFRLPGARDNVTKIELFNVLDDFFSESNVWQESQDIEITAGTTTYYFYPFTPSAILRLISCKDPNGFPVAAYMDEPGTLILRDTPSSSTTYTLTYALTVSDPTERDGDPVAPEWILGQYQNVILDGVMARMMSQLGKPYTNMDLAAVHAKRFASGTGMARSEFNRRNLFAAQRWRFPSGFSRLKALR